MKKNVAIHKLSITALLMGMCFSFSLIAQDRVTVQASVGSSNVEVNGLGLLDLVDPYIKPVVQYSAGIQYEKYMSRQLAVVTGVSYASRGFGARENFAINAFGLDIPLGASLETRLNYVEVPLMLKYDLTDGGVQPYVMAGVSAGYALNGKITSRIDALISWRLPDIPINLQNDMYNRWDVAGLAGAGVSIPVNEFGALQFQAQYRHSLNDMFLDNITNIRIKSHGISAGIGYSVRF